jgi:ABC-type sugar transport system substrate-binding protein
MGLAVAAATASGTATRRAGTSASGLAQARAVAAQAQRRPTSIGLTTPITKAIPKGKKIYYVACGAIKACTVHITYIRDAAKQLGWTATMIPNDGVPEHWRAAVDTAIRKGADAIITTGITRRNLEPQIRKAKAKGIPFVTCCTLAPVGNGIIFTTSTLKQNARIGKYLAAKAVSDTSASGGAVYVDLTVYEILKGVGTDFKKWYKKWCPSCKYGTIDIPLSALGGRTVPDTIVAYLRAHKDVNYVVLSEMDALAPGLPEALRSAGLDDVKIIGQAPESDQFPLIKAGEMAGGVPFDFVTIDWLMVDSIARTFAHVPVKLTAPPLWLLTKQNVPNTKTIFPVVANYKSQFLKLWHSNKS